jgi:adenosylmethionine-8-amino-7-oxononanoate aminotransferase
MEQKYSISIYPGTGTVDGKSGDHVLLCPAYIVAQADIEMIVDRAATVIEEFFAELKLGNKYGSFY